MLSNPTAPLSKSIGTRYLTIAEGIQIGFTLRNTSTDARYSELNYSCPSCLQKVINKRFCENHECEAHGEIQGDVTKAYSDGSEGVRIEITPEDLENLMMPPPKNAKGKYVGSGTAYPGKDQIIVHSRLTAKAAQPYLFATTKKYFLAPEKGPSVTLYSTLQEALQRQKMCLMVKFCVGSLRQQLAIIHVEDDMLVLAVVPFAAQLRTIPVVNRVKVDKQFVDAFVNLLEQVPEKSYEEAVDDYQIAFDYLVETKTQVLMEKQLGFAPTKKAIAKKSPTPLETELEKLMAASAKALAKKPSKELTEA